MIFFNPSSNPNKGKSLVGWNFYFREHLALSQHGCWCGFDGALMVRRCQMVVVVVQGFFSKPTFPELPCGF